MDRIVMMLVRKFAMRFAMRGAGALASKFTAGGDKSAPKTSADNQKKVQQSAKMMRRFTRF